MTKRAVKITLETAGYLMLAGIGVWWALGPVS